MFDNITFILSVILQQLHTGLSPVMKITGGKSGQHRVAHHLTGGVLRKRDTDSATENNRSALAG